MPENPTSPVPPPEARPAVRLPTPERSRRAREIVTAHTALVAGINFIPGPMIASMAVTGVQLNMLSDISKLYGVPFSHDIGRALLASAAGGVLTYYIGQNPVTRGIRDFLTATVPLIAYPLRLFAGPVFVGGYTLVLGNAFVRHYENGGTYLDFNWRDFRHELARKLGLPPPSRDEPLDVAATPVGFGSR